MPVPNDRPAGRPDAAAADIRLSAHADGANVNGLHDPKERRDASKGEVDN